KRILVRLIGSRQLGERISLIRNDTERRLGQELQNLGSGNCILNQDVLLRGKLSRHRPQLGYVAQVARTYDPNFNRTRCEKRAYGLDDELQIPFRIQTTRDGE